MGKLFNTLLDSYNILSSQLIAWEKRDDAGKVLSVTLFIPFLLVQKNNITCVDIEPLLPVGWVAKESRRNEDMKVAMDNNLPYTFSIAISKQEDAALVMARHMDESK